VVPNRLKRSADCAFRAVSGKSCSEPDSQKVNLRIPMDARIRLLNSTICGWINYFSIGAMKVEMEKIDAHLRTMLRKVIWKQWKTPRKKAWRLRKLGINDDLAKLTSYCGNRYEWGCQAHLRCKSHIQRCSYTQRPSQLFRLLRD
jgi:hypothetical protein